MFAAKSWVLLLLLGSLAVTPTANAGIYKWVDDDGNVHYGDSPPTGGSSQEIQVAPGPSDEAIQEAHDRLRRLQEYEKEMAGSRDEEQPADEGTPIERPEVEFPADVACFTRLQEAWGGRIEDTRAQVSRRPLTDAQLRQLTRLFNMLEGRPSGTMEETICISPKATPPSKTFHYRVQFDARWQSERIFWIKADLLR